MFWDCTLDFFYLILFASYVRVVPVEEYCAVNYCGSLLHHDSNLLSYLMPSYFDLGAWFDDVSFLLLSDQDISLCTCIRLLSRANYAICIL